MSEEDTKPIVVWGYCKNCGRNPLAGNYSRNCCSSCLEKLPAAQREQALRALNRSVTTKSEEPKRV